ncbi:twitching motility protein PilT [Scytonema hofmannii PCC 7110]|uniref:Twitching motility protein PilT n=1 Tax=Scytonema hofmannii PCC 7110 TaxID=128403 RepID=A0A139WT16_9CYAN|nr:PIN domain-containing protein [Scytonema hofmannii]KYC35569.1 twitching motility protein PilT [Scytonema hofmannii PCC 7110]
MSYLVDTNVLLRSVQETHPMHKTAVHAVKRLLEQGEELCVIPQNLIEFWVVATRPTTVNGLGLSITSVLHELAQLKSLFTLKPDESAIFLAWENLVVNYQVLGKPAHDTRLVAAMIVHNLTHLLTFNTNDFSRFSEITTVDPKTFLN